MELELEALKVKKLGKGLVWWDPVVVRRCGPCLYAQVLSVPRVGVAEADGDLSASGRVRDLFVQRLDLGRAGGGTPSDRDGGILGEAWSASWLSPEP